MFLTMACLATPVALVTTRTAAEWGHAYGSGWVLGLMAILVVCCTLVAFVLMNRWQPVLPAPEAGLIYAAEPVFASIFALFVPAWISSLSGIAYDNERLTGALLGGGGLITLANVLVQMRAAQLSRRDTVRPLEHSTSTRGGQGCAA
jgi:drug/metabolite transporter (DMT)-like permease